MPQGHTQLRTAYFPCGLGVISVIDAILVATGTSSLTFVSIGRSGLGGGIVGRSVEVRRLAVVVLTGIPSYLTCVVIWPVVSLRLSPVIVSSRLSLVSVVHFFQI